MGYDSDIASVSNNKRLAKNTLFLFIRMLLTMGVALFTVKVVLSALGTENYGVYNIIGGIVSSFSILTVTLASATQRFFAFEIGKKNLDRLNDVFSLSLMIYGGISLLVFFLAETLGWWFLNHKLNIPLDRLNAAQWVFHFSVLSFIIAINRIPYNALIIAKEKMEFYAYVSILEVVLKLVTVYFLLMFALDKLKVYSVLTFLVMLLITAVYLLYCRISFKEIRFHFYWEKKTFYNMLHYSVWSMFGSLTSVSFDQGINFLLNIFFGTIVNAARGIAYQVNGAISAFSMNLYSAVVPQIVKSYAEGNISHMMKLVFRTSNYMFYLMLLVSTPVLLETKMILGLWLNNIPAHTVVFVQLILVFSYLNFLEAPITAAVQATGNVKKYEVYIGVIMLLGLPLSYFLLKIGMAPESSFIAMIFVSAIAILLRLKVLKELIPFNYSDYFNGVIVKMIRVLIISYIVPVLVRLTMEESIMRFFVVAMVSLLSNSICIWLLGLERDEKAYCKDYFRRKIPFLNMCF